MTPFQNAEFENGPRDAFQSDHTLRQALEVQDPVLFASMHQELCRQIQKLELIASENYVSPAVMAAQGSCLTNKYAEGYPGRRYYGGCEAVDEVERLAQTRLEDLFHRTQDKQGKLGQERYLANVQPHSGSQANMAVYFALLKPGDKILGMNLAHGGHLTHGSPVSFSGRLYQTSFYGVDPQSGYIDYEALRQTALKERPKLIIAGASAYPRTLDFRRFREIADECGALLMVDMAHIAGLVASGHHPSPLGHAHVVTSTTHKTLRGPRGGVILYEKGLEKLINSQIFPGIQGGPLMHVIAAKAVSFGEALRPSFKEYGAQIISNARALASSLMSFDFKILSGGTDNHLMLVDLRSRQITGKEAEKKLGLAGLTVNKNAIPDDPHGPMITSGIRLGVAALTTRGMNEKDMDQVGRWIHEALLADTDDAKLGSLKKEIAAWAQAFPLFCEVPRGQRTP